MNKVTFQQHYLGAGYRGDALIMDGKYKLSIVAGNHFYSTPRADLDSVDGYSEMEVAIFDESTRGWATYNQLEQDGIFDIIGYGEYGLCDESERDMSYSGVFAYVPISLIEKLINL